MEFYKEERLKFVEELGCEVPEDWEVVRLGKLVSYVKGKKPKVIVNSAEIGLPYLSTEYLRNGIANQFVKLTGEEIVVDDGELIVLWDGSNAGELFLSKKGVLSSTCVKLTLKRKECYKLFLFYLLKYRAEPILKSQTKGTGIPHVDKNVFNSVLISFPPLPEQKAIAEILSTVDEAIQKTDEIIARVERLKKGLMQELLTGKVRVKVENGKISFYKEERLKFVEDLGCEIPEDWEVVRLGDTGKIVNGFAFPLKYQGKKNGKYLFVKVNDTNLPENSKYIQTAENTIDDEIAKELKVKIYPKGTIIFPKIGMVIYLRKVRILAREGTFDNNIMGIVPNNEKVYNEFLYYYMLEKIDLTKIAGATTTPSIRKSDVEELKIPLPPLEEQKAIAEILSTLDKKLEIEKKEKERLERIKKGLMDVLLTGKVRVKVDERERD